MAGFTFAYRKGGGSPTIQKAVFKDTETLTRGDVINIESGLADLGATADTTIGGVCVETKAGTTNVSTVQYIGDVDAVYSVVDANARKKGATLDLTGATGAQGVTTSSDKLFVVAADSSASEPTLVGWNTGKHLDNKAL